MDCATTEYNRRSLLMVLLCLLLAIVVGVARREAMIPSSLRWAAALLPVLPMVGYFIGLGRWLRTLDELQRLIQYEALFIQFSVSSVGVMAWGLLAKFGVVPNESIGETWQWLWVLLFFSWVLGQLIVRRKYR